MEFLARLSLWWVVNWRFSSVVGFLLFLLHYRVLEDLQGSPVFNICFWPLEVDFGFPIYWSHRYGYLKSAFNAQKSTLITHDLCSEGPTPPLQVIVSSLFLIHYGVALWLAFGIYIYRKKEIKRDVFSYYFKILWASFFYEGAVPNTIGRWNVRC